MSDRQIAKELERSPSTISRKFKRGVTHNDHSQMLIKRRKMQAEREKQMILEFKTIS